VRAERTHLACEQQPDPAQDVQLRLDAQRIEVRRKGRVMGAEDVAHLRTGCHDWRL
jgi:hypothetical protein